jgi:hypothetical protein
MLLEYYGQVRDSYHTTKDEDQESLMLSWCVWLWTVDLDLDLAKIRFAR